MDEKIQLTKQFKMVEMCDIEASTNEKPIIGTEALSPCLGFILHSKEEQIAIVGHVSCEQLTSNYNVDNLSFQLSTIVEQTGLQNKPLDLKIIEGAYRSEYSVYSHELDILDIFGKSEYSLLEVLEEVIKKSDYVNVSNTEVYKERVSIPEISVVDELGNTDYDISATLSKQFAFDARSGEFVTDKVLFGLDYIKANNNYKV